MKDLVLQRESLNVSFKTIDIYKSLTERKKNKESILSKQLLLSATRIGDYIRQEQLLDAYHACSSAYYWLRLLIQSGYLDEEDTEWLENKLIELKQRTYTLSHKQK